MNHTLRSAAGVRGWSFSFLKMHHVRITHMHVRDCADRDLWANIGTGVIPIADMLKYVRDNKYDVGSSSSRTAARALPTMPKPSSRTSTT